MGSDEKFCLQWNEFAVNLSSSFRELRESEEFYDVTLCGEPGLQVRAHKVEAKKNIEDN